jgi:hypothetical protein
MASGIVAANRDPSGRVEFTLIDHHMAALI